MSKTNIKIKNAINHFNDNRKDGEEKLNQTNLGGHVLPDMNSKTAGWYISQWCDGLQLGKLKPEHVVLICEKTGVDPNFLFGYESTIN